MSAGQNPTRWTVHFSGHVQGVGFRYTTQRIATSYAVVGYVRNLPDGRVEVVAEGTPDELRRFIEAIEEQLGEYVRDRRTAESPARGDLAGFDIRH